MPRSSEPPSPEEPPAPEGLRSLLSLDSRAATVAYWSGVALVALALFVPRLLPCTDYPQHLALADVARRLLDPRAPEHFEYSVNYFTYNGLFHVLVAQLSRLLPIETAGRVVVAGGVAVLGGGVLALVRALGRPPAYAALFTPILFSFALGWGFVNYALGSGLAVAGLAAVTLALRRPTLGRLIAVGAFALACAMTHVMATLLLCLLAAAIAPEVAWRAVGDRCGEPVLRRAWRASVRVVVGLAPILVGAAWCVAVYVQQYAWDPSMYKDRTLEGSSPPIWQKLAFFGAWATGLHSDFTDQVLLGLALLVPLVAVFFARRARRRGEPIAPTSGAPLFVPLVALGAAYLITPMVFIGTHLIFPRLTQGVVIGAILAAPAFPRRLAPAAQRTILALGVLAGLNLFAHAVGYARETDDASRVIDETPPGRNATAVMYGSETFSFRNGTLVHLAAYYGARKHGDWAFSFGRYLSVPVRYRAEGAPPWPRLGWEFGPMDYNPRCKYARRFDLVFVKAPADLDDDAPTTESAVRTMVFHQDAAAVKLLSHHGAYWAFDTQGLPDDGTF